MTEPEESFCYFGTPLDSYDEDAFPKKKPISLDEQIATDSQGRRRFHGAFTGGFSAGFFNTVGSLEGWTPSEFKSTRQDKAENVPQKPEDFMDEEDLGEYGIAHKTVKATNEFSTTKKRKKQIFSDGSIPGEPVLQTLLTSGNETVGYLLLKNIGIQDKILKQQEETKTLETRIYGCQMPSEYQIPKSIENKQYKIPPIYKEFLEHPKSNSSGLGYEGLDKKHINLFQISNLIMKDKNNKKVSISGQAFGVGAFEEEDDDIYMKEDMSKYDFELTNEKKSSKQAPNKDDLLFGMFKKLKIPLVDKRIYPIPSIPHSFTGKHKVRKSRFEPIHEENPGLAERNKINPEIRAQYLGESTNKTYSESKTITIENSANENIIDEMSVQKSFDISSILISDRFVTASQKEDIQNILEPVQKCETVHGTKELREAARMKMYGQLTRVTSDWHPCNILCKRFNVPEPILDRSRENNRKRTKNLIFEYQKYEENDLDIKPGLSIQSKEEEPNSSNRENISEIADTGLVIESIVESQQTEPDFTGVNKLIVESSQKDITEKVDVAAKLDLFKAVFLSSGESEEDEDDSKEEKDKTQITEEHKANILSDQLIPKIKPIKEGILSNVNFIEFSKSKKLQESDLEQMISKEDSTCKMNEISYGPQLPIEKYDGKHISKVDVLSSDSEDEWVEVHKASKKKKAKHKKKHKKDKHKKNKHGKRLLIVNDKC